MLLLSAVVTALPSRDQECRLSNETVLVVTMTPGLTLPSGDIVVAVLGQIVVEEAESRRVRSLHQMWTASLSSVQGWLAGEIAAAPFRGRQPPTLSLLSRIIPWPAIRDHSPSPVSSQSPLQTETSHQSSQQALTVQARFCSMSGDANI
jgi:hypothetical protein